MTPPAVLAAATPTPIRRQTTAGISKSPPPRPWNIIANQKSASDSAIQAPATKTLRSEFALLLEVELAAPLSVSSGPSNCDKHCVQNRVPLATDVNLVAQFGQRLIAVEFKYRARRMKMDSLVERRLGSSFRLHCAANGSSPDGSTFGRSWPNKDIPVTARPAECLRHGRHLESYRSAPLS